MRDIDILLLAANALDIYELAKQRGVGDSVLCKKNLRSRQE